MKTASIKAAFFGDVGPAGETILEVYGQERIEKIGQLADVYSVQITRENLAEHLPALRDLEVIFATWGFTPLTPAQLDELPALKAVFYAGGTVKYFAVPMLERGIAVSSTAVANAVPVAEFTVGQILLANKGYFRNQREYRALGENYMAAFRGRGNYGATIALLGAGQIGRKVIELLKPYRMKVLVFDPFLGSADARFLGAEKVSLEEAFARGDVVSNHLADIPETVNMLGRALFAAMPADATFINTGRGRTVRHEDLIAVMRARQDLTALLDVTLPEPLTEESPLWKLPNVYISGHIAGSIGEERVRNADYVIEEFERWRRGEPLLYGHTLAALARTA